MFFFIFYITKMDLSINIWKHVVIENEILKNILFGGQLFDNFRFFRGSWKRIPTKRKE